MDLASIAAGMAAAKTGFEAFRSALRLVKDVQSVLPPGEKKEAVAAALVGAETQLQVAEAQLAQAFGYQLCRCTFPPTPMLKVGWRSNTQPKIVPGVTHFDVHECPRCGQNDAGMWDWDRKVPERPTVIGAGA